MSVCVKFQLTTCESKLLGPRESVLNKNIYYSKLYKWHIMWTLYHESLSLLCRTLLLRFCDTRKFPLLYILHSLGPIMGFECSKSLISKRPFQNYLRNLLLNDDLQYQLLHLQTSVWGGLHKLQGKFNLKFGKESFESYESWAVLVACAWCRCSQESWRAVFCEVLTISPSLESHFTQPGAVRSSVIDWFNSALGQRLTTWANKYYSVTKGSIRFFVALRL